jgi:hypothetical protein
MAGLLPISRANGAEVAFGFLKHQVKQSSLSIK